MNTLRVFNLLVFLGRAGVASIVFIPALCCFRASDLTGVISGAVIMLFDAPLWYWALCCPLWIDVNSERVLVRYVFSQREYPWTDLKLFMMSEVTRTGRVRNTHCFANFRTKAGKWFKVRVGKTALPEFDSRIPDSSRGKSILGRIDTDPLKRVDQ